MTDKNALDPNAPAPSAEDLRMTVLDAQMKEIEKREKAKDAARKNSTTSQPRFSASR